MGSAVSHSDWELQRERLSAYLDGEVSADDRTALESHLPGCAQCQLELAALRQTHALLAALPTPSLPRSFTLPAEPTRIAGERRAPVWSRPAQAIGSIAAMVGLGLLVGTTLPHLGDARSVAGAATSASAPAPHMPANVATLSPGEQTKIVQTGSATTAPTPMQTPEYAPDTGGQNVTPATTQSTFPVLPVSGGVLLVGGVAAAAAGSVARRRARYGAVETVN